MGFPFDAILEPDAVFEQKSGAIMEVRSAVPRPQDMRHSRELACLAQVFLPDSPDKEGVTGLRVIAANVVDVTFD